MTAVTNFTSPLFYDKISQELNVKLDALGYIDDLYPVCYVGYDDEETYPEVYVNDGTKTSLRVMPDSTRSLSFFIVNGEMTEIDEVGFAIPMSYMVWMNLTKVDSSKAYDFTAEVIRDVYNVIFKYGGYDVSVNVNEPFGEFTQLSKQITANLMRPYSGFRVDFTKNVQDCSW